MPIRRRNPRKKVILAGIQGLVIGVVGVLLFGFILNMSNDKKVEEQAQEQVSTPTNEKETDEKVEVTGEAALPFKAKQYGMFTSKESAMSFISTQPSLEKASIVRVGNEFYVWSELFVNEVSTSEGDVLPTFLKTINISTNACADPKVKNIINILQEEKLSKNYFDSIAKKENYPDDMMKIVTAVSTFSDVSSVIRLHVFTHYLEQNDCLKLNF
ncbi:MULTISPECIES: hypothetical protein [Bacillaceae]|uniref:hypothetical protein n=1 Tax=Bacillaceae TaxID=186817 RepID=UPI0006FA0DB9|nr:MULTISPECIES: hypothetical protein [Bacillaceae]KQL34116.1 hypothetical protein AN959_13935 [Psychrobacillus sp. FJAT-21963]MDF2066199.1 hypothetical protein [Bacillus sp. Cr_A10]